MIGVREAITQAHYEESARVVAALAMRFGNLDIAQTGRRFELNAGQLVPDWRPGAWVQ